MTRYASPLILALCGACAALSACDRKPATDIDKTIEKARQEAQAIEARLAALPPRCTVGDANGTESHWTDSRDAKGAPGQPYTYDFAFKTPIRTKAFHVALNAKALQNLEKVETRDAGGTWTPAWTGTQAGAPAGCDFVKVAQRFAAGEREVTALRVTIRPALEKVIAADAGVLKVD